MSSAATRHSGAGTAAKGGPQAGQRIIAPGATIGILGGGQLGRMTAMAAARLGYRVHVYCPEANAPAAQVAADWTHADYDDMTSLERFARACDVVTLEFENLPAEPVAWLASRVPVRPRPGVLAIAQDRLAEKSFASGLGIATAPYARVDGPRSLAAAVERIGLPAVLKTTRMGYDGKGQVRIDRAQDLDTAWAVMAAHANVPGILERFIRFEREVSVIVARGLDGGMACYEPVENQHAPGHILSRTLAPARLPDEIAAAATAIALRMAKGLDLVGLVAVEMFVAEPDAAVDGQRVLVNEIAARPHNSGHWTMDACASCQFEQLVRAVCGLPLGSTERVGDAVMVNLLGDEAAQWPALLAEPGARLHIYGKAAASPGRKMGHVNRVYPLGRRPDN